MDYPFIIIKFLLVLYWVATSYYMIRWHHDAGNLGLGTFILAIFVGPAIAPVIRNDERKLRKLNERDRKKRWWWPFDGDGETRFRRETQEESIRNYMTSDGHMRGRGWTIPPPPPRPQKNKSNFKFFRGYDKVR